MDGGGGTVVKMAAFSRADMEDENDWKYVAGIVHIPSADTFYCHREEAGDGVREFRPLHSSWLRICRHADAEGQPRIASGGYVKRVISSYLLRLRVWGGDGFPVRVLRAVQFHDSNVDCRLHHCCHLTRPLGFLTADKCSCPIRHLRCPMNLSHHNNAGIVFLEGLS